MASRNTTQRDRDRDALRRAGGACHICGQPIDYGLPHLDPMAFVADHVIPLAQGGRDELGNKAPAHRSCNRAKGDSLPALAGRSVTLICGPPGAGKTTLAHTLGVKVYDLDDPEWNGDDTLFRAALVMLARDRQARAAVIRSGATRSARLKAARLCGATEIRIIETELDECIRRIKSRGRTTAPIHEQVAAAKAWWRNYQPGNTAVNQPGVIRRSNSLRRP